MGIADRDYVREPAQTRVGSLPMWSVTTWLIVINIAAFVLNNFLFPTRYAIDRSTGQVVGVLFGPIERIGAFTVSDGLYHFQVWRFITYQFLHANLTHIAFNMISLYIFGPLIEQYLGKRRYLAFYLISGIGGAALFVILTVLGFLGSSVATRVVPLVGASAAIFGILIAAAQIAPNATVLIWGSIPARLKTFAWVMLGIAVLAIFGVGGNAGGQAAHLGGAVVGLFLIRNQRWLNVFAGAHR